MKKLFNLVVIAMIGAMSLTSCENDSNEIQNIDDSNQNLIKENRVSHKTTDKELIENAIYLIKKQENNFKRPPIDSIIIDNPELPDYEENGTILCSTGIGNSVGFACVKNDAGKLVKVSWKPLYYLTMPDLPSSTEFNPIIYSGVVVSQCNC